MLALALREYTTDFDDVISKLHNLCLMLKSNKYRALLRIQGCNLSPKIKGHKWCALYAMLVTHFGSVGGPIEVIVRNNPFREFDDRYSFTPSERNQLIQLKSDLGFF